MTHPIERAIDALVDLCRGAAEFDYVLDGKPRKVEVVDGPARQGTDEPRQLGIGVAAQYVLVAGRGQERAGYGGRSEHQIDITCQAQAWSGDTDMAAARAAATQIVDGFRALLIAHPDLNGAVGLARMSGLSYKPLQSAEQGAAVQLELVVRVNGTTFDDE